MLSVRAADAVVVRDVVGSRRGGGFVMSREFAMSRGFVMSRGFATSWGSRRHGGSRRLLFHESSWLRDMRRTDPGPNG